ncbi:MAG TPA: SRPBCC family protein, partial [Solirubrobacterales bacterium]
MKTVRVERSIAAPAGEVFELLTDHAGYASFRGVRSAELVREGTPDPNGAGAMRRVAVGPIRFDEEITAFDRPRRMDYVIREMNVPFDHEGGTIAVEGDERHARVVWTSTFRVPTRGEAAFTALAALAVRTGFA